MLPGNHKPSHKPGSYPVTTPPPGHQRNRIACSNCRKRKVKCISKEKYPTSPCERCSKEGTTCEYVAISNNEGMSSGNDISWAEPLDPESYARSQGAFPPAAPASRAPSMYPGYGAYAPGYPNQTPPFRPPEYSHSSQFIPAGPGSSFRPGNQPPATAGRPNAAYSGTSPQPPIYYGVSEPTSSGYPGFQPQVQPV
ncbi:hypothetical protein B0H14DRAFT_3708751 [Mycena olivaceomarginata]|nr:hypothetical protein B0H14DRAFT_3708751 [Mycena olivaceomarginata]